MAFRQQSQDRNLNVHLREHLKSKKKKRKSDITRQSLGCSKKSWNVGFQMSEWKLG